MEIIKGTTTEIRVRVDEAATRRARYEAALAGASRQVRRAFWRDYAKAERKDEKGHDDAAPRKRRLPEWFHAGVTGWQTRTGEELTPANLSLMAAHVRCLNRATTRALFKRADRARRVVVDQLWDELKKQLARGAFGTTQ